MNRFTSLSDHRSHPIDVESVRRFLPDLLRSVASVTGLAAARELGADWLYRQGLAPLAWRWAQPQTLPDDVRRELQVRYYAAVADAELHAQELSRSLAALNAFGIEAVTFKGAALAYTIYPDPVCRGMSDLDFWIKSEHMTEAQKALEGLGYHAHFKPDRPLPFMVQSLNELPMVGTRGECGLIELHWSVFPGEWLRRAAAVDHAGVWGRTSVYSICDQPTRLLASEDNLIQVSVHFAISHNFSSPWLRSLADVTLLARHRPLDWNAVIQRARTWRIATATWLVLSLAEDLCGLHEAADAVRQLAPSHLRQKLIGLFANADSLVNMRDLSRGKWRYLYLLLLVDRKRDALKLIFRTLWPEDDWLRARYGQGGWRVRLRHLLGATRGRI